MRTLTTGDRDRAVVKRTAILATAFPTVGILLLNGYWNGPLYRAWPAAFWALDFTTHVAIPVTLLVLLMRRYGVTPNEYGLAPIPHNQLVDFFALSAITTFLYWLSYQPVAVFFGKLLISEPSLFTYFNAIPEQPVPRLLVGLYFSLSAALFEEIMYRGLPWLYCKMCLPTRVLVPCYVATSATLFGFAHWENGFHEVIGTGCLGVVGCLIFAKTRTLWPLIVAHFLIDIVAFV